MPENKVISYKIDVVTGMLTISVDSNKDGDSSLVVQLKAQEVFDEIKAAFEKDKE